jgi:prepilin-type N-terminal cleavage/methylation domain-containing protein
MTRRPPARPGFSLIELLVVIAIIGLLAALTLAAVQRFRVLGPRTKALSEISQMDEACAAFKNKFGFNPPTTFTIPLRTTDPGFAVYQRMFVRFLPPTAADKVTITPPLPGAGTTLVGSASLAHFLAGPGLAGWAIDAPVAAGVNASAKTVFFEFDSKRFDSAGVYYDPFGAPYAYFGSRDGGGYDPLVSLNLTGANVFPFKDAAGKWVNPKGVQVICAGPDGYFGPGGSWSPGNGVYVTGQNGGDDFANFNDGKPLSSQ